MALRRSFRGTRTISDINVTPMVDITLVLLIIFMVTASFVSDAGIKVRLPKASTTEASGAAAMKITLGSRGEIYLLKERLDNGALRSALERAVRGNPELRVMIAADRAIPYGTVVGVIDIAKKAGVTRVGLATER
jgi:biopolymer transport protein ExbD